MQNTTVVAFYGDKPRPLEDLIGRVQTLATVHFQGFVPRPMPEVHATLVGLETQTRDVAVEDLPSFLHHVGASLDRAEVVVQFGGFADREYPIDSRGRRLYERSFLINGESVVLIGWPVDRGSGQPIPVLDDLRRSYQDFGFRHRYHVTPDDSDPDCYLVVGRLPEAAGADQDRLSIGQAKIRHELAAVKALRVALRSKDIRLVRYESTTLPTATSRAYPIGEMTIDRVRRLLSR